MREKKILWSSFSRLGQLYRLFKGPTVCCSNGPAQLPNDLVSFFKQSHEHTHTYKHTPTHTHTHTPTHSFLFCPFLPPSSQTIGILIEMRLPQNHFWERLKPILWRRKWQPTPVFLPWKISGTGEPGGLPPMGSHIVKTQLKWLSNSKPVLRFYIFLIFFLGKTF